MSYKVLEKHKLQNDIHYLISQTRQMILRKNEIMEKYLVFIHDIDYLIYIRDIIICIGIKWTESKPNINDVSNFIKSIDNIHMKENYKKCVGIYLTKVPISKNCLELFEFENNKQTNYFTFITNSDIKNILDELTQLFYSNDIYLYEADGTAIMIE